MLCVFECTTRTNTLCINVCVSVCVCMLLMLLVGDDAATAFRKMRLRLNTGYHSTRGTKRIDDVLAELSVYLCVNGSWCGTRDFIGEEKNERGNNTRPPQKKNNSRNQRNGTRRFIRAACRLSSHHRV